MILTVWMWRCSKVIMSYAHMEPRCLTEVVSGSSTTLSVIHERVSLPQGTVQALLNYNILYRPGKPIPKYVSKLFFSWNS